MMHCLQCQTPIDGSNGVCPRCGWRAERSADQRALTIARPGPRPKIQATVQLACTVDRTGSTSAFEAGVQQAFEMVARYLEAKTREVKVFLFSHADLDYGEPFITHTNGGTPDQAIDACRSISYGGGGDAEESHLDGIESVYNTVPWRDDPSRVRGAIMAFLTADTKPARSGISAAALGRQIRDRGILLYLICQPTPTLHELVSAAEGMEFPISNNPDPADLQKIAAQLGPSIAVSVGSGSTIPLPA